jgi:hypothetical protein
MPNIESLLTLLHHASVHGSKTTVLNPLIWLVGIELSGLVGLAGVDPHSRVIVLLEWLLALSILGMLLAYAFFAFRDPDALRSEKYTLTKMALQQGLRGDDLMGFVEPIEENQKIAALPTGELQTVAPAPGKKISRSRRASEQGRHDAL